MQAVCFLTLTNNYCDNILTSARAAKAVAGPLRVVKFAPCKDRDTCLAWAAKLSNTARSSKPRLSLLTSSCPLPPSEPASCSLSPKPCPPIPESGLPLRRAPIAIAADPGRAGPAVPAPSLSGLPAVSDAAPARGDGPAPGPPSPSWAPSMGLQSCSEAGAKADARPRPQPEGEPPPGCISRWVGEPPKGPPASSSPKKPSVDASPAVDGDWPSSLPPCADGFPSSPLQPSPLGLLCRILLACQACAATPLQACTLMTFRHALPTTVSNSKAPLWRSAPRKHTAAYGARKEGLKEQELLLLKSLALRAAGAARHPSPSPCTLGYPSPRAHLEPAMPPLTKRPDCRSRCSATGPNSENSEPHDMRLSALLPCAQGRAPQ